MAKYEFYAVEITRFGPVGVAIVTAYTNPGGYPRAESFLLIPDKKTIFSQKMSFDVKSFQDSPVELTEDFMLAEALQQAKIDLGQYIQESGNPPHPDSPNFSKDNINLLVHTWIRGTCPHINEVYKKTGLEELKDAMRPILNLPVIEREGL